MRPKRIIDNLWKEKYLVAVYHSGTEDLYRSTLALMPYNRKRCDELAVKREKSQVQPRRHL